LVYKEVIEMGKVLKDILKSTVISIGMALTIFCLVGIFFDITYGGNFSMEGYQFTKMVIGSAIVGIGFGVPTVVYNSEKLPMPVKVLIHMGIGCVIYTAVAYAVGWFGGSATPVQGLAIAGIQLVVAFIIWFCFNTYYRKEAKQMNDKIQSMKK
jgi:predicted MFS family arabinose efflux permease